MHTIPLFMLIYYDVTIDKCWEWSLVDVPIYFLTPVFIHCSLYVALSRINNKKRLKFVSLDYAVYPHIHHECSFHNL